MYLVYKLPKLSATSPLRLSASARGLLGLIYINIGILKVNAGALNGEWGCCSHA